MMIFFLFLALPRKREKTWRRASLKEMWQTKQRSKPSSRSERKPSGNVSGERRENVGKPSRKFRCSWKKNKENLRKPRKKCPERIEKDGRANVMIEKNPQKSVNRYTKKRFIDNQRFFGCSELDFKIESAVKTHMCSHKNREIR